MKTFDDAFSALVGSEGGYVNDPRDPGGATRWGITETVAREQGYGGDMKDLPYDEAKEIAKRCYWDKYHCDEFDIRVGFQVFDSAYNGGHPVAWLQTSAGLVADGILGPQTLAAVKAADPVKMAARICSYRLTYMTLCEDWKTFSGGWAKRLAKNLLIGASDE